MEELNISMAVATIARTDHKSFTEHAEQMLARNLFDSQEVAVSRWVFVMLVT